MKSHSIYFHQIQLSKAAIQEANSSLEGYEAWIPSHLNHLKVQQLIETQGWQVDFSVAVDHIKSKYDTARSQIPFEFFSDNYQHGINWIERAIKKQLYYFLSDEVRPSNYPYRLANPLTDNIIQQEIIARALGWDYWCNDYHNEPVNWRNDTVIHDLLTQPKYKSSFNFPFDYQLKDGQLASWALALLGKRMRELRKIS